MSFNPRTRTGCDDQLSHVNFEVEEVSTHAPARGATATTNMSEWTPTKFQPTHPHGVRLSLLPFSIFNHPVSTHAPARGATLALQDGSDPVSVSTHAPARGATNPFGIPDILLHVSTHAPARGATMQQMCLRRVHTVSTHAPARGATFKISCISCLVFRFNPRTRTGCDGAPGSGLPVQGVSTHAPARGATEQPKNGRW